MSAGLVPRDRALDSYAVKRGYAHKFESVLPPLALHGWLLGKGPVLTAEIDSAPSGSCTQKKATRVDERAGMYRRERVSKDTEDPVQA